MQTKTSESKTLVYLASGYPQDIARGMSPAGCLVMEYLNLDMRCTDVLQVLEVGLISGWRIKLKACLSPKLKLVTPWKMADRPCRLFSVSGSSRKLIFWQHWSNLLIFPSSSKI